MANAFVPGQSMSWDYLWQSTLFLGLGLLASVMLARRPARAHRSLLLVMLAALVTPILAQAVGRGGWGILGPRVDPETTVGTSGGSAGAHLARVAFSDWPVLASPPAEFSGENHAESVVERWTIAPPGALAQPSAFSWRELALVSWLILTALAATRLVGSAICGLVEVERSRPLTDDRLAALALTSATRLGVGVAPELRSLSRISCPAIWSWRRRPIILLPDSAGRVSAVDWAGILCHELAHWIRRDHLSALFAELLACLLPWQPLAWWARQRLRQLGELACDDWVLATGLPAADYAEALLSLAPRRRSAFALTAVSSRRGLARRVRHVLEAPRHSPAVGRLWACLNALAVVLAASTLALAQNRATAPQSPSDRTVKVTGSRIAINRALSSDEKTILKRAIRGGVVGPDGKPASGAMIYWLVRRKMPISDLALPPDEQDKRSHLIDVMAATKTSSDGAFSLTADFAPDQYERDKIVGELLLAKAPGAGMLLQSVSNGTNQVILRLTPEVVIQGRLITPSGQPAVGVRVTLASVPRMHLGLTPTDDAVPPYWPQPLKTDSEGRFRWEGLPQDSSVGLNFWHPEFAVDEVSVDTAAGGGTAADRPSSHVPPTFTHALEPARPVQGRLTDKETGKPLAGILVEVSPMRTGGGGRRFHARSDASGRYRVSGYQADRLLLHVRPPADSGYFATGDSQVAWPVGSKFLEKNYALDKGRIVRGRVIDADSKLPIAHAAVAYQPKRGNPNIRRYDLSRSVTSTDKEGRFTITTAPGAGIIAVETPNKNYIRVMTKEGYPWSVYPQGLAELDVPKDEDVDPVEITVRQGVTLEARAVDPEGQSVPRIMAYCKGIDARLLDAQGRAQEFTDGVFRLHGADPNKTYRVYFLHYKRQLGAVAGLKYDPQSKKPIDVRLEPTAQVHGEVVRPDGSRAKSGQILPALLLDPDQTELKSSDFQNRGLAMITVQLFPDEGWTGYFDKSRLNGTFRFDHLIPGVRVAVNVAARELGALVVLPPLKPGEDRDLGTITLKERQP